MSARTVSRSAPSARAIWVLEETGSMSVSNGEMVLMTSGETQAMYMSAPLSAPTMPVTVTSASPPDGII